MNRTIPSTIASKNTKNKFNKRSTKCVQWNPWSTTERTVSFKKGTSCAHGLEDNIF